MMTEVTLFTKPSVACSSRPKAGSSKERVPRYSRNESAIPESSSPITIRTLVLAFDRCFHVKRARHAAHPCTRCSRRGAAHSHRVHECTVSIRPSTVHPVFSAQLLISNHFRRLATHCRSKRGGSRRSAYSHDEKSKRTREGKSNAAARCYRPFLNLP